MDVPVAAQRQVQYIDKVVNDSVTMQRQVPQSKCAEEKQPRCLCFSSATKSGGSLLCNREQMPQVQF